MNHLEKSLSSFFGAESRVIVIKGEWGVGKTYFWDNYISSRIKNNDISNIAYSYISLFGKTSLKEVRASIFHNARPVSNDSVVEKSFEDEYQKSKILFEKIPWFKDGINKVKEKKSWLHWASEKAQYIPALSKYSSMISTLEYSLVNNYVICFDDMERKGKGLEVKEVMSLIDELAERKNCKVVLIFNESSLDNGDDKKQFEVYREKVVDMELCHNPSFRDNLECVFLDDSELLSDLEPIVSELNLKNIRVLRKIKWMNDCFFPYFSDKNEKVKKEYILHAVVLCWGYYIRNEDLTFDILKSQLSTTSWLSYLSDSDREVSKGEKKYQSIATNLKLSVSKLDSHIIYFLEHGYIDAELLKATVDEIDSEIQGNLASDKLNEAWSIYSDSLSDNFQEFKAAIEDVLDEELARLGLAEFSSAIDILSEFGDDVSEYINKYIDTHSQILTQMNSRRVWETTRVSNEELKQKISELENDKLYLNIDDVAARIAKNKGWNPEDIDFLCTISKNEFIDWMKSEPENLVYKVRGGLLLFRNISTSDSSDNEKYEKITNNVVEALREISSENEFNKKRIKFIYEVE